MTLNNAKLVSRQAFLTGGLLSIAALAQGQERTVTAAVDKIFAAWDKPETPGCSLAVVQDGKVIYARGYGRANLEYDIPNAPSTVFHIASVSKQFTAFTIQLLAREGKLSLDDDIRKYLPELQSFSKTITIRHLIHHTSGLRDQWSLLVLAGWRMEDVITEDDILRLIWRQKELNFTPGAEELYSNTGYTLLGVIVKRVSGKSLPDFAQERIFRPLGMSHTHFHDDHRFLVKGRAYSYARARDGYQQITLSYANVGATSLFTTVEDLARWDQNFYEPKVGDKAVLEAMHQRVKLTNGKEIAYASALVLGEYRGLKIVEHSGGDAGFRSHLIRFPEQHFSVVLLGNAAELNTGSLVRKVADLYLADKLKAAPVPSKPKETPPDVTLKPQELEAVVGDYALSPEFVISITREGSQLFLQATGQGKAPLFPTSPTEFFLKVVEARVTFAPPGKEGKSPQLTLHQNGADAVGKRVKPPVFQPLAAFAGEYYSDELHVLYTLFMREGKLFLKHPRGEYELTRNGQDQFISGFGIGQVAFQQESNSPPRVFRISNGRVRNLKFERVEIKPK